MGSMILVLNDYDGDKMQMSFETDDTAAGTYAADLAAAEALADAIEGITLGNRVSRSFVGDEDTPAATTPANPFAQTNIQWVATYTDNVTGAKQTKRIGTADLSQGGAVVNGVVTLDLSAGVGATLKTAFEAIVISSAGNAVTLESVHYRE